VTKPKKQPEHFTMQGTWVACLHCGAKRDVIPSQGLAITKKSLKSWQLAVEDFYERHGKCPCTPESPLVKLERNEVEWEQGLFVGTSSATIFRVMTGRWPAGSRGDADTPSDPGDFGRCHRLLRVMPEWRARMGEVAAKYRPWVPLVAAWDELTALYETKDYSALYDRMKALRGEAC
jgi:hypothetical protein